jgi:hypothetical protein
MALLLLLVVLPAAANDEQAWKLARDEDGIKAYLLVQDDSPLLAFKAEAVLDASVELVLSVVLDAEHAEDWIPRLAASEVLRWIDEPRSYIQYTEFDAPWPVSNRTFVSRVDVELDPTNYEVEIRYAYAPDAPLNVDAVQGSADGSYYILVPIDGGRRTHFTAVSVADPKGRIPSWLINWIGKTWAHSAMSSLQKRIASPEAELLAELAPLFTGFDEAMIRQTTIQAMPVD